MNITSPQPYPVAPKFGISDVDRDKRWQWILTTAVLFVCGFFALPHDLGIAKFLQAGHLPGALKEVLERAETFAHGIGITAILIEPR